MTKLVGALWHGRTARRVMGVLVVSMLTAVLILPRIAAGKPPESVGGFKLSPTAGPAGTIVTISGQCGTMDEAPGFVLLILDYSDGAFEAFPASLSTSAFPFPFTSTHQVSESFGTLTVKSLCWTGYSGGFVVEGKFLPPRVFQIMPTAEWDKALDEVGVKKAGEGSAFAKFAFQFGAMVSWVRASIRFALGVTTTPSTTSTTTPPATQSPRSPAPTSPPPTSPAPTAPCYDDTGAPKPCP